MKKRKVKNNLGLKGTYKITTFRAGTKEVLRVSETVTNLIMLNADHGLNLILQALGGSTTYPIEINRATIGTGTTPPVSGDVAMQTPVLSGIIKARATVSTNTLVTEWFMSDTELVNGTYTEFGLFCGSQLFARSIITPSHTKGSLEDTLIEYTITATNT